MAITEGSETRAITKKEASSLEVILSRGEKLLHRLNTASNNISSIANKLDVPSAGQGHGETCENAEKLIPRLKSLLDGFELNISSIETDIENINEHV